MTKVPFHIQRASLIDNVGTDRMDPEALFYHPDDHRITVDPRDETGSTVLFGAKRPWVTAVFDLSDKGKLPFNFAEVDVSLVDGLLATFGAVQSLKLVLTPFKNARITPSLSQLTTTRRYLEGKPRPLVWEIDGECAITHMSYRQRKATQFGTAATHLSGIVSNGRPQPSYTRPALSMQSIK